MLGWRVITKCRLLKWLSLIDLEVRCPLPPKKKKRAVWSQADIGLQGILLCNKRILLSSRVTWRFCVVPDREGPGTWAEQRQTQGAKCKRIDGCLAVGPDRPQGFYQWKKKSWPKDRKAWKQTSTTWFQNDYSLLLLIPSLQIRSLSCKQVCFNL